MFPKIRALIRRHRAATYFLLTFAISLGGIAVIIAPSGFVGTKEDFDHLFGIVVLAMVAGPAIAGVLSTWLTGGRGGLREYRSRLLKLRVRARWYAITALTAPSYFLAALLALSLFSSDYLPGVFATSERASLIAMGIFGAIAAGVFEELGWTGFAIPALRRRHGTVATGLIVGVLWSLWHFPVKIWGAAAFGTGPFLLADLSSAVLQLTAYRILMVWVYDRTESLPVAMLMHFGLTASTIILAPITPGLSLVIANLILSIGWWVVVAGVVATWHTRASRPSALGHAH